MAVSDYIYFNSKLRALMSYFLSQEEFVSLAQTENVSELIAELQKHRFYNNLNDLKIQKSPHETAKQAEILLWNSFETNIFTLQKSIPNPKVKNVVSQISRNVEIENLKKIIAFVCYKKENTINPNITIGSLKAKELIKVGSLDELLVKLEKTEYYPIILPASDLFKKDHNFFHFSLALDKYFFDLIFKIVKDLDPINRSRVENVFLFLVERFNLQNLIRFQKFYNMSIKEIIPYLYPKGSLYPYTLMQHSFVWEDYVSANPVFKKIVEAKDDKESIDKLNLFEQALDLMFVEKIKTLLLGNPFSPGIFLAFYFLYHLEIKKIIFLLNGKLYNLPAERLIRIM